LRLRPLIVALLCISLTPAVAACGGSSGELTEEEYFLRMDAIDKSLDRQSEEIFATANISAVEGAERLVTATDNAKDQYQEIEPPDSLKDAHDVVIEAVDEFGDAVDGAANDAQTGTSFNALFENDEVASADEDLRNAYCTLQGEADRRSIAADVGCN
jgi:hypothetical protein